MSQSWFDQVDEVTDDETASVVDTTAGIRDDIEPDDTPTAVLRPIGGDSGDAVDLPVKPAARRRVAAPRPPARELARTSTISLPTTALMAVCVVGLGGVGVAAVVLGMSDDEDAPAQPAPVNVAAASAGGQADSARAVGVAGDCAATASQVDIEADSSSLRGAVAAFETAYYSQDADGVMDTVADGSGLSATDWDTVLPEAAPEGVSWCAVMQPESGPTVDIDLTVTDPDGDITTYPQTIRGEKTKTGSWQLVSVSARE